MTRPQNEAPQRRERHELCQLFRAVGPDVPTLCDGWATRHLAAHLVVREWNPLAAAGIVIKPLAHRHDQAILAALRKHRYEELVDKVDHGPPLWWRPLDPVANLVEFVVHHEDARRGVGGWEPRPLPEVAEVEAAVWKSLHRGARLYGRRLHDVALELRLPASTESQDIAGSRGRSLHLGRDAPVVVAEGRPIELLLFLTGRQRAARVTLDGPRAAVAALDAASLGL